MIRATVSSQSCFCWLYRALQHFGLNSLLETSYLPWSFYPLTFLSPQDSQIHRKNLKELFGQLYRAFPSLAAKNIISLISVSTIWWCPCVESSLVSLEEGVCYDQCILLAKLYISLCPASFCIPRPNLPFTPGVSWLPTFAFQSPIMKRTSFLGC